MNSETHSCMHSFASLAIFAFSGRADFMILATGAKLRMLASESRLLDDCFELGCTASEEEGGEVDDMIARCKPAVSEALLQRNGPGTLSQRTVIR
jgi:hypothetical protein